MKSPLRNIIVFFIPKGRNLQTFSFYYFTSEYHIHYDCDLVFHPMPPCLPTNLSVPSHCPIRKEANSLYVHRLA